MKRFLPFMIVALLGVLPLSAQASDVVEEPAAFKYELNVKGDQYIRISLAPTFPMNFPDFPSLFVRNAHQLGIGGLGTLGYHYFILKDMAVGFDVGFGFNVTIGSHVFNYVPVVGTFTYQPCFGKFEIPLTIGVGFAWETYANKNYFPGLFVKPEIGLHYRLDPSWSVGGEVSYVFMPQFLALYGGENAFGHFMNLAISARYYF